MLLATTKMKTTIVSHAEEDVKPAPVIQTVLSVIQVSNGLSRRVSSAPSNVIRPASLVRMEFSNAQRRLRKKRQLLQQPVFWAGSTTVSHYVVKGPLHHQFVTLHSPQLMRETRHFSSTVFSASNVNWTRILIANSVI